MQYKIHKYVLCFPSIDAALKQIALETVLGSHLAQSAKFECTVLNNLRLLLPYVQPWQPGSFLKSVDVTVNFPYK